MNFAVLVIPFISLLFGLNDYRAVHALPELNMSYDTCRLAMERLEDIKTDWSHTGFFKRVYGEDFSGWWGEDLAKGFPTQQDVLAAWEASPSHNANLLADAPEGCIASDGYYWVLEVHKPSL